MPSEWATARAPSTASGEQQALAPSVSGSAQSLRVTPTTSAPRSRSSSAATALSTPPDMATSDAAARAGPARRRARGRGGAERPVQGVGGELGGVALGRRQPAERRVDLVDPDPGAARTGSPSTISATAAVAARVAPQPSASKLTAATRPSSIPSEIRERSPQAAPPAAPVKAPSGTAPRWLSSRRYASKSSWPIVKEYAEASASLLHRRLFPSLLAFTQVRKYP